MSPQLYSVGTIHTSNSNQMSTFNILHYLCNEFLTFIGNAGI